MLTPAPGTTSVRFMIFNERAEVQASHGLEFTQFFEHPGWQDQDAHEIVDKVNECIDVAVRQLEESGKGSKKDIKVIGKSQLAMPQARRACGGRAGPTMASVAALLLEAAFD
jgi:hypothetical protein